MTRHAGILVPVLLLALLLQPSAMASQAEPQSGRIDVNSASVEELQRVPGIGPTMARRIVDWRREHGPFQSLEDLLNVRGIGVKTLEALRPYLEVRDPEPSADAASVGLPAS